MRFLYTLYHKQYYKIKKIIIFFGEYDEKIIAIPKKDPFLNEYRDISEIPAQTSAEIMHFFEVYKQLQGNKTTVDKMMGREEAEKIIQEALENYKKEFENK